MNDPSFGCCFSAYGRGDCEHFIGLPGKSMPNQHDGQDDTVDDYGKPNGWCWSCWKSYLLEKQKKEHDEEIGEFQDEVRDLIIKLTGAPDGAIDGAGSDAGWQEFTLAEISQGIIYLKDKFHEV